MQLSDLTIRAARDDDAEGLMAMIEGCFHEYDCVMVLQKGSKPMRLMISQTQWNFIS